MYSTGVGDVDVENRILPAGTRRRQLFRIIDKVNTVVGVGATGVKMAAYFFPVAQQFTAG